MSEENEKNIKVTKAPKSDEKVLIRPRKGKNSLKPLVTVIILIIVVGFVVFLVLRTTKSQQQTKELTTEIEQLKQDDAVTAESEIDEVVAAVNRLISLPSDETPTLATITDKERLGESPFLQKAQNGDRVLIYMNAKKAYLYRPDSDRLVDVATVNLTNDKQLGEVEDEKTVETTVPPTPSTTHVP